MTYQMNVRSLLCSNTNNVRTYRPGGKGKLPLSKVAAYCLLAASNSALADMIRD